MTHDISHCDAEITPGELCTRRNTCYRYIAHLDLIKHPMDRRVYLNAFDCTQDTITPYSKYWRVNEKI